MCLPMLTYCLGALDITGHIVKDLGVSWNDCFRRIFNYNRWESERDLQHCCGLRPMYCFYSERLYAVVFVCRQLFNVLRITVQVAYCKHASVVLSFSCIAFSSPFCVFMFLPS